MLLQRKKLESSTKYKIISNYISQGYVAILSFAFTPLYIEYLGSEGYGVIAFFALVGVWSVILEVGISATLMRESSRCYASTEEAKKIGALVRSVECVLLIISALFCALFISRSEWIAASWIKSNNLLFDDLNKTIIYIGIAVAIKLMEGIYKSILIGCGAIISLSVFNIFSSSTRAVGSLLVLYFLPPNISTFMQWQLIASIVSLIVIMAYVYKEIPGIKLKNKFSLLEVKENYKFSFGMLVFTGTSLIATHTDKLLLSKMVSIEDFGLYMVATSAASIVYIAAGSIMSVYNSKFNIACRLNVERKIALLYHECAQLIAIGAGCISLMLIVFSLEVVTIWGLEGDTKDNVAAYLTLISIGNLLSSLNYAPHQMQIAHGWTVLGTYNCIITSFMGVLMLYQFVPKFGVVAAGYIWILSMISFHFINYTLMHKKILKGEGRKWLLLDVVFPIFPPLLLLFMAKTIISFDVEIIGRGMLGLYLLTLFVMSCLLSVACSNIVRGKVINAMLRLYERRI